MFTIEISTPLQIDEFPQTIQCPQHAIWTLTLNPGNKNHHFKPLVADVDRVTLHKEEDLV